MSITRREMAAGAGAAALAGCGPRGTMRMPAPQERQFPADFVWGVASSAYQIEGAVDADGRGPSIWDVFPRERIHDGTDGRVANDSYHRYGEDVALIADAGLKAYRFSVAWPRIVPAGGGEVNQAGIDYYARLIDAQIEHGVTPYATLFHWDLPQALQERGGWTSRDTADRFADYAAVVTEALGDRLKHIVVLNEAAVHALLGHVTGDHAPGLRDASQLGAVIHHQNLAQGKAIQAMRAGRSDLTIGTTMALMPSRPQGAFFPWLNQLAAEGFDDVWNGAFLDSLFNGTYPGAARDMTKSVVLEGDMATIRQPIDFLGVNYYSPAYMRFNASAPSFIEPGNPPEGVERDAFDRHVDPVGLYEVLLRLNGAYGNPRVLITENGCSDPFSDSVADHADDFRIDYLRRHLEGVKRAMEVGCNIGGYFHWTLVDNWEWAEGYRSKFGLVAQNRDTGARTVKRSYSWFKTLAETGLLDD